MSDATASYRIIRVTATGTTAVTDRAAAEEPLEIRVHGEPFAVVMRTPGADKELAAGFLFSEGVIREAAELGTIEHCARADRPARGNVVDVRLLGEARSRLAPRRRVVTNASCGICGRTTLDAVMRASPAIVTRRSIEAGVLLSLPDRLREKQSGFALTGGLHAAGLYDVAGHQLDLAEDIGRHNAVDKVVGRALMAGSVPLGYAVLAVSGRASFEIVQKAVFAGIPVVCAVSAPSSLAIDLAREAGVTLAGFVRGHAFNLYAHPDRIAGV